MIGAQTPCAPSKAVLARNSQWLESGHSSRGRRPAHAGCVYGAKHPPLPSGARRELRCPRGQHRSRVLAAFDSVCSCCTHCTLQAIGRVRELSRRILSVLVAHSKQSEGLGNCHGEFCRTLQAIRKVRELSRRILSVLVANSKQSEGKEIVTANSVCSCCTLQAIGRVRELSRRILSVLVAHSKQSEG